MVEDKQRIISGIKSQNCQKVDQAVIKEQNENRVGNIPKLLNFSDKDDLLNSRKENKMEDSVEPHTIPSTEVKLSEKGEYYTDKSVVDYEVREQIACNLVKDICVDEELPFLDKILIEHGERTLSFQPSCLSSTDVSRKSDDSLQLISDEMKSLVGDNHNMGISSHYGSQNLSYKSEENINSEDVRHNEKNPLDEHIHDENVSPQHHSKNQSRIGEANIDAKDEIPYNMPDERVPPENFVLLHNSENENGQPDSYLLKSDIGQQHSEQEQLCIVENLSQKNEEKIEANDDITKCVSSDVLPTNVVLFQRPEIANSHSALSNFNSNEDEQQFQQDIGKKLVASYAAECSASKQASARPPFDCNVERGSITFNFDFPKSSNKEEIPHNGHLQTLPVGLQEGTVDDLTTSSRSFSMQDGPRESSFSAVGPLSGPISYSGPVPFSGSISIRSDSSTTSTRSFAFPILHAESNGSPVKMAKPDRKPFRKHRSWWLNLLCCRF